MTDEQWRDDLTEWLMLLDALELSSTSICRFAAAEATAAAPHQSRAQLEGVAGRASDSRVSGLSICVTVGLG
jgi:hypothetical protein